MNVADPDGAMLFPPVVGIVPDGVAVDADADVPGGGGGCERYGAEDLNVDPVSVQEWGVRALVQDANAIAAKLGLYDFETGTFEGLPRSIEKAVGSNPGFTAGIRKGLAALGEGQACEATLGCERSCGRQTSPT
ncbi:hypothetical protein ABZ905_12895 [Streptomyces parvus]|uniref:hypothetical protein n=1 Tax=Streptomyces parvus TaxID=66428 RepID=UPI0033C47997